MISKLQIFILSGIAKKIVLQGPNHRGDIIKYYDILNRAARLEFIEDSNDTLNHFLKECHLESLKGMK